MSELKGQILGIILVIVMFGVIGVAMKGVFSSSIEDMSALVESALVDME